MREVVRSTAFKKDVKRAEKRGKDMRKLRAVILLLLDDKPLEPRHRDHPLKGDWVGYILRLNDQGLGGQNVIKPSFWA